MPLSIFAQMWVPSIVLMVPKSTSLSFQRLASNRIQEVRVPFVPWTVVSSTTNPLLRHAQESICRIQRCVYHTTQGKQIQQVVLLHSVFQQVLCIPWIENEGCTLEAPSWSAQCWGRILVGWPWLCTFDCIETFVFANSDGFLTWSEIVCKL